MKYRTIVHSLSTLVLISVATGFAQTEQQVEENAVIQDGAAIIVSSTEDMDGGGIATRVMAVDASDMGDGAMFLTDHMANHLDFSFGDMGSSFSMLNNPSVQKDLQLVDDQLQQIEDINAEFSKKIKDQIGDLKDEDGNFSFSNPMELSELIQDLRQQQQDQIDQILLPNQQRRLKQVARQMKMKRTGTAKSLTGQLAEELGISSEQQARIEKRSKELQEEINQKLAELKAKAKEELMCELSQDQRRKLEELLGDEFIVKDEDNKNRFRRFMHRSQSKARDF